MREKGGWDDGLQMKMPLLSNLMIFLRTALGFRGGDKEGCKKVMGNQKKDTKKPTDGLNLSVGLMIF